MGQIQTHDGELDLDEPTLVEGFPGVGLVGKIATDHLIEALDMEYYASVRCQGLPRIGVYRAGKRTVKPPVRIYASEAENLLALQSDVPIGASAVENVAGCVTSWMVNEGVSPIYLSGFPAEREDDPSLFGIATGAGSDRLADSGVDAPTGDGAVSGPTGALLNRAAQLDIDGIGLIVESNPQFPDPEAARVLIEEGVSPLAGIDVDVGDLLDRTEEIRSQRERLAQRMGELGEEESSQAKPMQMFQ